MNREAGPHQTRTMPQPWSWTSSFQNCEKNISVVYLLPSPWHFCYNSPNGPSTLHTAQMQGPNSHCVLWTLDWGCWAKVNTYKLNVRDALWSHVRTWCSLGSVQGLPPAQAVWVRAGHCHLPVLFTPAWALPALLTAILVPPHLVLSIQ